MQELLGFCLREKTFLRHLFIGLLENINCTLKAVENGAFSTVNCSPYFKNQVLLASIFTVQELMLMCRSLIISHYKSMNYLNWPITRK